MNIWFKERCVWLEDIRTIHTNRLCGLLTQTSCFSICTDSQTLFCWDVLSSPPPKVLTTKYPLFFCCWDYMAWLYMAFTAPFQVLCQSAWLSEFQGLIWSSNLHKQKKNTLEVQKNWTRSASEQESSEQLFFFFLRVNCAENSLNCRTALSISKREGEFAATLQKLAVFVRRAV